MSVFILILLSSCASANEKLIIPNTDLKYVGNTDNVYIFKGEIELNGLLRAYWNGVDDELFLNLEFFPEKSSKALLPYINDLYNNSSIILKLNDFPIDLDPEKTLTSYSLDINENIVKKHFGEIPPSFWQEKSGSVRVPALITIKDFAMQVECDSRHYYATTSAVRSIDKTSAVISASANYGCGYKNE